MTGNKDAAVRAKTCPLCGGETAKGVLKTGNHEANVVIAGKPDGFLGVVPYTTSPVAARVCTDCGHITLFARNLESLLSMDGDANGVLVLLEAARKFGHERFVQISTDEVYGSTQDVFREGDPLEPNQPYSAAKAGGELMARAYYVTFGVPTIVTRGSNTFGPYHYPEKLIPLFVTNAIDDLPLPMYGDGRQVREWMHVIDHAKGADLALHSGTPGEVYNVGSGVHRYNIDVTKLILQYLGKPESLIRYVTDRPGHDRRYSMDCSKINALGFAPDQNFEKLLEETVRWYVQNESWWRKIKEKQAEYKAFTEKWYAERK